MSELFSTPEDAANLRETYPAKDETTRAKLMAIAANMPLIQHYWTHFKWLYKQAEAAEDLELLAMLMHRIDTIPVPGSAFGKAGVVSQISFNKNAPNSVFADGSQLVVGDGHALHLIDASNPFHPQTKQAFVLPHHSIMAAGNGLAFVLIGQKYNWQGIDVIDYRDSNKPQKVATIPVNQWSEPMITLRDNYLIITCGGELTAVDISDPTSIKLAHRGRSGSYGYHACLAAGPNHVYVGNYNQIEAITMAETGFGKPAGKIKEGAFGLVVVDSMLIAARDVWNRRSERRLEFYDLSDPEKPRPLARINRRGIGTNIRHGWIYDNLLFLVDARGRVAQFNIENRAKPVFVACVRAGGGIRDVAFADNHLYVLTQTALQVRGLAGPSSKTIGYVKRRANRYLAALANKNPNAYLSLSSALLRQTSQPTFDVASQWLTSRILYGGGDRLSQKRHGRGRFLLADTATPQSEVLHPELWRTNPGYAIQLLTTAQTHWRVREAMALTLGKNLSRQILIADGLCDDDYRFQLVRACYASPSIFLIRLANAVLAARHRDAVPADLLASWYFYASPAAAAQAWRKITVPTEGDAVACQLSTLLAAHLSAGAPASQRILRTAHRLVEELATHCPHDLLVQPLAQLLGSSQPVLQRLGCQVLRGLSTSHIETVLEQIAIMDSANRDAPLAALLSLVETLPARKRWLEPLVLHDNPWIRQIGWKFLSLTSEPFAIGGQLWARIITGNGHARVLETALVSPEACGMLPDVWGSMGGCNGAISRILDVLDSFALEVQQAALANLRTIASRCEFDRRNAARLAEHSVSWRRATGWAIVATSATNDPIKKELLQRFFNLYAKKADARFVFERPEFIRLLREIQEGAFLDHLLRECPELLDALPHDTLLALLQTLNPKDFLPVIAGVDEDAWERLSGVCLEAVPHWGPLDFWRTAEAGIAAADEDRLATRLLGDPRFVQAFVAFENDDILKLREASFDEPLLAWVQARSNRFVANAPVLCQAATHRLPGVRRWALAKLVGDQMQLWFVLRLLECGLPESMMQAENWLASLPAGSVAENEALYGLLDSPDPAIQARGRQYLETRTKASANNTETLVKLSENPDPEMQAYVASRLAENPDAAEACAPFDRVVMRARRRARRAKELVMERLDENGCPDTDLLCELARSRTAVDADWAWQQLALLAESGKAIDGLSIDGKVGS